jgi:hypothetical protein
VRENVLTSLESGEVRVFGRFVIEVESRSRVRSKNVE